MQVLLICLLLKFISVCSSTTSRNLWKGLKDLKSLYPPTDLKNFDQYERRLNIFQLLLDRVTLKHILLKASKPSQNFPSNNELVPWDPKIPVGSHRGPLTAPNLFCKHHESHLEVGQVVIQKWYKLKPKELKDRTLLVGFTKNSNMPLVFNFTDFCAQIEQRDCFITNINVSDDLPFSKCSLKITCFDPKETKTLTPKFKQRLENTIEALESLDNKPNTKLLFDAGRYESDEWRIFSSILDFSLRKFAAQEARKRADSPKLISFVFWQIYEELWMKILPRGAKFYNPDKFLTLQPLNNCYFYGVELPGYTTGDLRQSLQTFQLICSVSSLKTFDYNGKDAMVMYLGPFTNVSMSWPTISSPLYFKEHAFPEEWLSAVILLPPSFNKHDFYIKIHPDQKVKKLLLSIDAYNETLLKWEGQFVKFHRDLPKIIRHASSKALLLSKSDKMKYVRQAPSYEFRYLLNGNNDRNCMYTYKGAPSIMPSAIISLVERVKGSNSGLPLPPPTVITMIPSVYHLTAPTQILPRLGDAECAFIWDLP